MLYRKSNIEILSLPKYRIIIQFKYSLSNSCNFQKDSCHRYHPKTLLSLINGYKLDNINIT